MSCDSVLARATSAAAASPDAAAPHTMGRVLADLLTYPSDQFDARLREAVESVRRALPAAAEPLAAFAAATIHLSCAEREELYTRTFDINPECSLEIGWQLFGEEYHRGALLVRLRSELRRCGIAESTELPDHLTHVLALLDRLPPAEARSFAHCCVIPAVDKMLLALAERGNPYGDLLLAAGLFLKHRFVDPAPGGD